MSFFLDLERFICDAIDYTFALINHNFSQKIQRETVSLIAYLRRL